MLLDQLPVRRGAALSEALAEVHEEEAQAPEEHAEERQRNIRVLDAAPLDPRRDAVAEREAHGVADDDHADQPIAADLLVAVDDVVDGDGGADRERGADHAEAERDADPVHAVVRADAEQDAAGRVQDEGDGSQPQARLRLEEAAVATGHPQGEAVRVHAGEGAAKRHADRGRDEHYADHVGGEVVGLGGQHECDRRVDDVEP